MSVKKQHKKMQTDPLKLWISTLFSILCLSLEVSSSISGAVEDIVTDPEVEVEAAAVYEARLRREEDLRGDPN